MTSVIATIGIDFIGRQPIYDPNLQVKGCFWEPHIRGQRLGVINLIVNGREEESRSRNDESASYFIPDNATADILSMI
jgi:hypothetical protein